MRQTVAARHHAGEPDTAVAVGNLPGLDAPRVVTDLDNRTRQPDCRLCGDGRLESPGPGGPLRPRFRRQKARDEEDRECRSDAHDSSQMRFSLAAAPRPTSVYCVTSAQFDDAGGNSSCRLVSTRVAGSRAWSTSRSSSAPRAVTRL